MNKRGAAMVEMGDHIACNTVIQCLGGQQLFGNQIDFRFVLFDLCINFFIFFCWVHKEHTNKNMCKLKDLHVHVCHNLYILNLSLA